MTAAARQQREVKQTSNTVKEVETMLQDFQCEACGQYKVRRTKRECWYTCINCSYSFGIKPHPQQRLCSADAGGAISH